MPQAAQRPQREQGAVQFFDQGGVPVKRVRLAEALAARRHMDENIAEGQALLGESLLDIRRARLGSFDAELVQRSVRLRVLREEAAEVVGVRVDAEDDAQPEIRRRLRNAARAAAVQIDEARRLRIGRRTEDGAEERTCHRGREGVLCP